MTDYNSLLAICQNDSSVSKEVVDDFLVYYASAREKTDRVFDKKISRFAHVAKGMPSNWNGLIKAQFIGHQIFKAGGLINKYLNHSAVKQLKPEQRIYLKKMADQPWRFSFGTVEGNPAPDFYEMEDAFDGSTYLLHSRSMSQTLSEHNVLLWFNLIGYNGSCWQTFGPVIALKSFSADDIFFYATEINSEIESEEDLTTDIEENPIQYMMLAAGSNYPLIESRGHEILQVFGQGHSGDIDVKALKSEFTVEYAKPVFRISHSAWSEHPHSTVAYYHEELGTVSLTGLTDAGYHEMAMLLKKNRLAVPEDPDIRIHVQLLKTMETVFKKRPDIDPYARLFEKARSPQAEASLAKLNQFMMLALPYINSGKEPDIDALAKKAGVDPESAREVLKATLNKVKEMRK